MIKTAVWYRPALVNSKSVVKVSGARTSSVLVPVACVSLMTGCLILLGMYLFGANAYAAAGYEMSRLQSSIAQLSDENKKLTLKVSEQSSIAAVKGDIENSRFVPVGQADYLEVRYYSQK